jgi:hypothetical protein
MPLMFTFTRSFGCGRTLLLGLLIALLATQGIGAWQLPCPPPVGCIPVDPSCQNIVQLYFDFDGQQCGGCQICMPAAPPPILPAQLSTTWSQQTDGDWLFTLDVTDAFDLRSFSLDLVYDSPLIPGIPQDGGFLDTAGLATFSPGVDDGAGTITGISGLVDPSVPVGAIGDGTLFTLDFSLPPPLDNVPTPSVQNLALEYTGGSPAAFVLNAPEPAPAFTGCFGVALLAVLFWRRKSRALLAIRKCLPVKAMIVFAAVLVSASPGRAGVIVNTGSVGPIRTFAAGDGWGQGVVASDPISVADFGFDFNMPNGGNVKYLIFDIDAQTVLFSQTLAVAASSSPAYVFSGPVDMTVVGARIIFALIGDSEVDLLFPQPASLAPLSGAGSNEYTNFADPTLDPGHHIGTPGLEIDGPDAETPEPGSIALVVLGLAYVAARRRA